MQCFSVTNVKSSDNTISSQLYSLSLRSGHRETCFAGESYCNCMMDVSTTYNLTRERINPNLIQDGDTERPSVISLHMVVTRKQVSLACPVSCCSEPEAPSFELTLPFGMELDWDCCIDRKGLNQHCHSLSLARNSTSL